MTLGNLSTSSIYVYRCGSNSGWSEEFSFRTIPDPGREKNWSPYVAIFGDMGFENAQALPCIQDEANKKTFDAILHVGDFAYDMCHDNGRVGDKFMKKMEPIIGNIPYMVVPGNHEEK